MLGIPTANVYVNSVTYNSTTPVSYTSSQYSTFNNLSTITTPATSGIMYGTSTTNGVNYNVFAFGSTAYSYTINYTCNSATTIYVMAVGGGGGGASYGGGAGGAGGVVMNPVSLPAGTNQTITITVGAGRSEEHTSELQSH